MSDYIPHTAKVSNQYSKRLNAWKELEWDADAAAEFDRWLLQIEYDAWNEGHRAGWTNKEAVINGTGEFTRNPYIK